MIIFKGIHIYNQFGVLATSMYLREVEKGEIEVTALGATDDSLDIAILSALQSKYQDCRFYESKEINENQIDDFKSNYNSNNEVSLKLSVIYEKANTIVLTMRVNEQNALALQDFKPITIQFKSEAEITDRQISTLKPL